jgi:predicted molibdopterin-dependent oxidoreductase YjgC
MVTLTIDEVEITAPEGTAILDAAQKADIYIPRLCSHPDLPPVEQLKPAEAIYREGKRLENKKPELQYKGCQLCVVQIEGREGFHRACLTCAQKEGCARFPCSMNIPERERCCPKFGNCEFQRVIEYVGIKKETPRYVFEDLPVIKEPLLERNYNLCIGRTRCVRACRDLRGGGGD